MMTREEVRKPSLPARPPPAKFHGSVRGYRMEGGMRPIVIAAVTTMLGVVAGLARGEQAAALTGVWAVQERSYARGDSSWTESKPQPGLYFFGNRHYAVQEIRESGSRPLFDETTSDLDRLAAFDVFHAHAGRYELSDWVITIIPTLAKRPNTMDGRVHSYAYELAGETLTITRVSPAEGERRVTRLRRVE